LHSYGFTSGVRTALNTAYFGMYTIIVIGALVGIYERLVKKLDVEASPSGRPATATS
jgi:Na+/glutamate symporter